MLFDIVERTDALFKKPEHTCPDCGAPMLPGKGIKHWKMFRCIYYPRCKGGKHKAKHVVAADKYTRKQRIRLHNLLELRFTPKWVEKWLSVYGTHAHIGEMMVEDIFETEKRYLDWCKDETRQFVFYTFFNKQ